MIFKQHFVIHITEITLSVKGFFWLTAYGLLDHNLTNRKTGIYFTKLKISMAKLFINGVLRGEELLERVPLDEWIDKASKESEMCLFLKESGKYFNEVMQTPPKGIVRPDRMQPYQCHYNNMIYSIILSERQPEVLKDFRFVSGFFGMKAVAPVIPEDQRYFIGHHSFMVYKGAVLDYTMLQHPPLVYEPDQYFGVGFEIEEVVKIFDDLTENGQNLGVISPLEILRKKVLS